MSFKKELLDDKLTFIYNKERQKLINKMDQYAKNSYIIEPMKITGNVGVGKSLTLQFYTSMELEGYNKFYFNLKLFEKYGRLKYFFIEMMRGFLSKRESSIKEDLKNYINCVNYMQNLKNINNKNFFQVLIELINYLKTNINNNIVIIDQFKYEYISDKDFGIFKSRLDKKKFRLIICCSLNDGQVKNKMFSEYEKDIFLINELSSFQEEDIPQVKENKENEIKIINSDNIEITEKNKINLKNIFILKKRKAAEKLNKDVLNKKKKENSHQINIAKKNNEDNEANISKNNIDYIKNEKSLNNNNKTKKIYLIKEAKNIYNFNIELPKKSYVIPDNTTPVNIYYNNLVDLKNIISEESKEIYNFMSNFKYLPKYYKKFNIFRIYQKINNINDDLSLIENFKKEISDKIKINIKTFYIKEYDNFENKYINFIANIIFFYYII